MRFQDMPYERIDFAKVQEEMGELIRELDAAKSGEEQFEVHKKYYALTDRVMSRARYSVIWCWLIRRNYMNPPTERIWRRRSGR